MALPAAPISDNVTPFTGRRGHAVRAVDRSPSVSRVYLLGPLRAAGPTGEDALPRSKKARALLAYLCLARGDRLPRSRVAGIIWDRVGEAQARESLRKAVNELEAIGSWPIEAPRDTLRLDISACWVDAIETPEEPDSLLMDLYGTSSTFDRWILEERARYEKHWRGPLEAALGKLVASRAAPDVRAEAAQRILNFMPTHEEAFRALMTALAERGDGAQVVREFERFQQLFARKVGILPSEQTVAVYSAIRLASEVRSAQTLRRPRRADDRSATVGLRPGDDQEASPIKATGPSIAVLPLQDLSGDDERSYVGDGLVEDLTETLSRIPGLFVSSRRSAAMFRNQNRTPQEIGEALGVRYLLLGTIRIFGDRLRLSIELTDTSTGKPFGHWRFDERSTDLLELQDRLTHAVGRAIAPHLRVAELQRLKIKRPEDYSAYDFFLRAQESMHSPSRTTFEGARNLFMAALEQQPRYATALAWLAYWHVMRVGQGWSPDPDADGQLAERYAEEAIDCEQLEPMALAVRGHVWAYLRKDFEEAFACFDKALEINANNPRAWLWSAAAHAWSGDGANAVAKIERAMSLAPFDPLAFAYHGIASMAYLANGQYERAIEFALRCKHGNPSYTHAYRALIFALVLAGRTSEAALPALKLLQLAPKFTVRHFRDHSPVCAGALGEACCDALAVAGVPL